MIAPALPADPRPHDAALVVVVDTAATFPHPALDLDHSGGHAIAPEVASVHRALAAKYLTPPEVARLLRVDVMKVLAWVRRGELAAVNVASSQSKRPRWRISQTALDTFLAARSAVPPAQVQRRRRRQCRAIEFFP